MACRDAVIRHMLTWNRAEKSEGVMDHWDLLSSYAGLLSLAVFSIDFPNRNFVNGNILSVDVDWVYGIGWVGLYVLIIKFYVIDEVPLGGNSVETA